MVESPCVECSLQSSHSNNSSQTFQAFSVTFIWKYFPFQFSVWLVCCQPSFPDFRYVRIVSLIPYSMYSYRAFYELDTRSAVKSVYDWPSLIRYCTSMGWRLIKRKKVNLLYFYLIYLQQERLVEREVPVKGLKGKILKWQIIIPPDKPLLMMRWRITNYKRVPSSARNLQNQFL